MSVTGGQDGIEVTRGDAPLIVSVPHSGTDIPDDIAADLNSAWLARKDTDWWVDELYAFAPGLGATVVRTPYSRTVIDVNRDPSGVSLYPGQATTGLCPVTTFDDEALYRDGAEPDEVEIGRRRAHYFAPYHQALAEEIRRLQTGHRHIVLYEAHSIRSRVPRLFDGDLPHFNIGTNDGRSCAAELGAAVADACATTTFTHVVNGRFKGGYTTRHYGQPAQGVHALQMELACRGYLHEPAQPFTPENWPPGFDPGHAQPMRAALTRVLQACIDTVHRMS